LLLANAGWAVEVGVGSVGQHLGEAGVEVEGVDCGDAVDGLREPRGTGGNFIWRCRCRTRFELFN